MSGNVVVDHRSRRHRIHSALGQVLLLAGLLTSVAAQVDPSAPPDPADARLGALQEGLDAERRRAAAAREELQRMREDLERRLAADAAETQGALDRAVAMRVRLRQARPRSPEIDELYGDIVREIVQARAGLRASLEESGAPSEVPAFETTLDLDALRASTLAAALTRFEETLAEIRRSERELAELEQRLRRERLRQRWDVVSWLNDVRISTLDLLTAARRARLLGLSREGVEQLRRELDHLALTIRVYTRMRWERLRDSSVHLGDVFAVTAAAWIALKVALVLVAWAVLWVRRRSVYEGSRRLLQALSERATWRRRFDVVLGAARVVGPWLLVLFVLRGLVWALGRSAARPEIRLILILAALYALYRLSIDVLVAGTVALVRRHRIDIGSERTVKLLRSARTLLRVVFAVIVLLTLSSRLVGQGYLYHVVFRLAVVAFAVVALREFYRWRADVVGAYLARGRDGWLKRQVQQSRERWHGGFVAAAALLSLAGLAGLALAREFALGFDQTRRALAFLFLRRIEKQAERIGYADVDAEGRLAPALREALTEDPVQAGPLAVDYYPGLDALYEAVARWRSDGTGGSFLLTGDFGVGRTSWLEHVQVDGLPLDRVTFERRIDSGNVLAEVLGEALGLDSRDGLGSLQKELLSRPHRMIVLDRGQNLFLGRVGGYAGFESFMSLLEATTDKVFWLVSFSQLAWEHIAAVHPQLAGFREHLSLQPWPEERIAELLDRRVAASGVEVTFDDLLADSLDGLTRRAQAEEIRQSFTRLLWTHSMGLPRVALHYWRRSLVPDGDGRLRVRLFRQPLVEQLERWGDVPLFMLGGIVVHESLTAREMSVVTRYPESLCRIHVARLEDLGVLRRAGIRYWVTSYWQPVVQRLLRRRNLLSD